MKPPFENLLQINANYDPNKKLKEIDTEEIFQNYPLEYMTKGSSSRVYKVKNEPWVVKEGRWDLDIDFIGKLRIGIPANSVEKLLNQFEMYFLPTEEHIREQYQRYFEMIKYLGYFSEDDFYHPELNKISNIQNRIRSRLEESLMNIITDEKLKSKIYTFLTEYTPNSNFLTKEYLLYGKSVSSENKDKITHFVVQKYISGETIHDYKLKSDDKKIVKQLVEFCLLLLLLNKEQGLVPDTRPRYLLFEAHDWVGKTDNIIVTKDKKLKFVDTRLIWDKNDNLVKRGIIIPSITERVVMHYLQKLL